jgi:predicted ATPase/DNA-binding SARP family transcriptional activator/DNA-binding CsgD family transcriptional regulator/Tfp pilus assembly protein PilF
MCPRAKSEGVARSQPPASGRPQAARVWLLDGFRVSVGSRTIDAGQWRLKKAANLVKLLALAPGHRLLREQAMNLLWPNSGRKAASNSLRRVLHTARKVLDPTTGSRYLVSEDESLVLCPKSDLWVDVDAFEEAASARRAREPATYRAAIHLYTGELLPDDRYEQWAEDRREELRQTFLSLLIELAEVYEQLDEYELSIEALWKVAAEESTNQRAHTGLMRLYALSGRQAEALAQFERFERLLSRELGMEPDASSRALREEIATGRFPSPDRAVDPPKRGSFDPPRYNLPASRTSFIGRERELVEIKRALSMTRHLTLTGPGGSGKTRLALEVGRDMVASYPDGVWLVELAALSDTALVAQEVARALEVHEQLGRSLEETLVEALREQELLLILDNCEHLIDAATRLVNALLDTCPSIRILATSREPLRVAGESVQFVSPLSVPNPVSRLSVASLEGYESVQLFFERARRRNGALALTPKNSQAVAEICWRLEGIPLAIELAAARVGALAIQQISRRLENSLKLLTGGDRMATPRQQSLRGALDWSHELLSEPERAVFRRLSVFAGGWTLEVAEEVCAGGGVEEGEMLDLLSGLLDKSMVVAETTRDGEVRYWLLEPVRQYALEKLEQSREAEATKRAHAEYFLSLSEEAEPELWGREEALWLGLLEVEHDNTRAALSWALEREEAELGLRLAGALQPFWQARGYYVEARKWLEEALANDGQAPAWARAKALEMVSWLANDQADVHRTTTAAEEGLKLSVVAQMERGLMGSFREVLGQAARKQGNYELATELFEESLAIYREVGDRRRSVSCLLGLGQVFSDRNDFERATRLYEEGLALSRELGYGIMVAGHSMNLGYALLLQGHYEGAVALNEEAVALLRAQGRRGDQEYALNNLGWTALLQGDRDRAKRSYKDSVKLCQELGNKIIASRSLEGLACVFGAGGDAERAARLFGAAQAVCESTGYKTTPAELALREPYLVGARSNLNEATWEAEVAKGQAMSLEEAVEYALSEEESVAPLSSAPDQPSADGVPILTRREQEIAALVARGLTNRQIAAELVISEHTAATHIRRFLKKLGLRSRAQLGSWLAEQESSPSD